MPVIDAHARAQQARHGRWQSEATAWASLGLIGLMWSLPLLQPFHYYPMPSVYSEWLASVLGLAALWLLAGRRAWKRGEFLRPYAEFVMANDMPMDDHFMADKLALND